MPVTLTLGQLRQEDLGLVSLGHSETETQRNWGWDNVEGERKSHPPSEPERRNFCNCDHFRSMYLLSFPKETKTHPSKNALSKCLLFPCFL